MRLVLHNRLRNSISYLLFGAFLQGDPVLSIRADVHFVGLDEVNLLGLLGDGALGTDGGDKPQESEIHLWGGWVGGGGAEKRPN